MGRTAVITGATCGIGAAYADRLAKDGYDLIITGRRKPIIEEVAKKLKENYGINVNVVIAELSDDAGIQKVIDAINDADEVDMLINNAGYANEYVDCMDLEIEQHEKMIKVQVLCPVVTKTDFYRYLNDEMHSKFLKQTKMFTQSTEKTVDYSLKALKKNKPVCLPGIAAGTMAAVFPRIPRGWLYKLAAKMMDL